MNTLNKENLISFLTSFNLKRVESKKLREIKEEILNRLRLENELSNSLKVKYKKAEKLLEEKKYSEEFDWEKIKKTFATKSENFKSMSEELLYYHKRLNKIENYKLKETFLDFVKNYLEFLDKIHSKINQFTSEEQALNLENEVNSIFGECPVMIKKAKEMREIAKNTNFLFNILQRIKKFYKIFDQNKESLKEIKNHEELDIQKIDKYENEFQKIYNDGVKIKETKNLNCLSQMKKSIESYITLRKKEKEFNPLRKFLNNNFEENNSFDMLGKRDSLDDKDIDQINSLKKIKKNEEKDNLMPKIEPKSDDILEESIEENSLMSLENSDFSDADSTCSNEYILKQRQKIRKLKSLMIRKKEEQNDLVNQSEEKTSSFLHKKFSLMLLYYKLKVLGLDLSLIHI